MINFIVVITLCLWLTLRYFYPEKREPASETPESLLLIVPCYNESEEELRRSLDSLVEQKNIEQHSCGIVIICDGRVRGPGMSETTANCLLNTILTEKTSRRMISNAYLAWDKQDADVILQRGTYRGVPYMCIIKLQNSGKRDGLILIRSLAWNFNNRAHTPATIFSAALFGEMASFILDDCGIEHVSALVGMDADTVFDTICIAELIKESRYVTSFPRMKFIIEVKQISKDCGRLRCGFSRFPRRQLELLEISAARCLFSQPGLTTSAPVHGYAQSHLSSGLLSAAESMRRDLQRFYLARDFRILPNGEGFDAPTPARQL
jgi:hypothetical protein